MVEPMETSVKSKEGKENKFVPKFNKTKNSGKRNAEKRYILNSNLVDFS